MIMTSLILMILLNIIVGACVGLTGIAGFLLPMFYTGFLNMPSTEALALSFSAFLVSGIIGSINFYRAGNLEIRPALVLSLGSLIGAIFGVKINLLIPESTIKVILYLVVLFSGISILLRKDAPAGDKSRRLGKADTWHRDRCHLRRLRSRRPGPRHAPFNRNRLSGPHRSRRSPLRFHRHCPCGSFRLSGPCGRK